jgi:DNA-binding response OmpR family regulator
LAKFLVVEDDRDFAAMVAEELSSHNHVVDCVYDGKTGMERIKFYSYDLAILDWDLPEVPGIEILRTYRAGAGLMPILMLTGKSAITDKSGGFEGGADDYLTKPCHLQEILLRVRALLRRPATVCSMVLKARDIELNPDKSRVTKGGEQIHLNVQEFSLLEFLLSHPEEVFSAEALLEHVWSSKSDATPAAVRMAIVRLRKKLQDNDADPLIRTLHRVGYRLDP